MSCHNLIKGSTKSRTTNKIRFIMVGQLSVGQYSHYQKTVEPGFPAGTFYSIQCLKPESVIFYEKYFY